jgi:gliding motility-associated-like protein
VTQKILPYVITLSFLIVGSQASGQSPPNDACSSASEIVISENGLGLGEFISDTSNLTEATREVGEKCSEKITNFGNCQKTVWYRFQINSTRNLSIRLGQADNLKTPLNTGVTVYQSPSCVGNNEGSLMGNFLPVHNFGVSGNECLSAGTYYVQVSCRESTEKFIYLVVNVDLPKVNDYDSYKNPIVIRNTTDFSLLTECTSLEAREASAYLPEEYTKSVWIKVPIAGGLVRSYLSFRYLTNSLAFRIFRSSINEDSLMSNQPYSFVTSYQSINLYEDNCKLSVLDTVIIQVLLKDEETRLELRLNNILPQRENTQWTDSRTPDRDTLAHSSYSMRNIDKFLDCNSLLTNSQCASINSLNFTIPHPYYNSGSLSLKYAGYMMLDIRDSGMLRLDNRYYGSKTTLIYRGDISGSCDLVKIGENYSELTTYCIVPGLYTLIYLSDDYSERPIKLRYDLLKVGKVPSKYNTPELTEQMGSIDPLLGESLDSGSDHYPDKASTISVDGLDITGRMTFREFNMLNAGSIDIQSYAGTFYIFKGSVKDGTATMIDNIDYSRRHLKLGIHNANECLFLDKGIHSLVTVAEVLSSNTTACESFPNRLEINGNRHCTLRNGSAESLIALNQNKNILEICDTFSSSYQLFQTFCSDCYGHLDNKKELGCLTDLDKINGAFRYFTFTTPRNMSLILPSYTGKSILYKGDLALNPDLLSDSERRVLNCDNGEYCNLLGGVVYTLLVYNKNGSGGGLSLNFMDHVKTKNDFISQAIDLGSFNSDSTVTNDESWITCHTNGYKDDVCFQLDAYRLGKGVDYLIPFPDSLNYPRSIREKTIWYTFSLDAPCKLDFNCYTLRPGASGQYVFLLKYLNQGYRSFENLVNNGFDTASSNFAILNLSGSLYSDQLLCEEGRYFIVIIEPEKRVSNDNYNVELHFELTDTPGPGDQCLDALNLEVPTYGNYEVNLNNYCHSFGGSPFEDGPSSGLATSWIEIDIKDLNAFKISIDVPGVDYTLYGGDCGALTPLASNGEQHSYFTTSCLASGTYYLQVKDRYNSSRARLVNIEILEEENSLCNPYDYTKPMASFTYEGGCGDLKVVNVSNASTSGEDMEYLWFINGVLKDSSFNFTFDNQEIDLLDTSVIKLVARNEYKGLSDSFSSVYIRDTIKYNFTIIGPDSAFCSDDVELEVSTTYTKKINYQWFEYYPTEEVKRTLTYDKILKLIRVDTIRLFIALGESDNCTFSDTFQFEYIKPLQLFEDTVLCFGEELTVAVNEDFWWNQSSQHGNRNSNSSDISFNVAGRYWLRYSYKSCSNTDTFSIKILPSESDSFLIKHCFEEELLELEGLLAKDYLWQEDSSSGRYYLASEYKDYPVLVTTLNDCRDSLIYTVQNDCSFEAFVPNTFTPNNDGVNDGFKPVVKSQFDRFEMAIYNRWGALIFDTKTSQSWDGMYENTAAQNGVYIYQIIVVEDGGARHFENGTVMILR